MYFIVNITKPPREITIADLNFTLGPNKAIDLEKVRRRSEIDDSRDLKRAISTRAIQVRHAKETKTESIPVEVEKTVSVGVTADDIAKIRAAVKEEMQEEMRKQLTEAGAANAVLPELLAAIKQLQQRPASIYTPTEQPMVANPDDFQGVSDDKLAEIQARQIAKTTKPMQGNVNVQKSQTKENVSNRVKKFSDLVDG